MKLSGKIGYKGNIQIEPGYYEEDIVEKSYKGELIRNLQKRQNSGEIIDNVTISNQISIVANAYASNNLSNMLYITFMGTRWKITDIEVQHPRLILTLGGEYNGPKPKTDYSN